LRARPPRRRRVGGRRERCSQVAARSDRHPGPMTTTALPRPAGSLGRKMLNKVPEVTLFFWIIKIMCTTVGETAADYLNDNLAFLHAVERTLSIHSIVTTRREAFYWLAILFTFSLGTAAGDLVAEKFSLGYGPSIAIWGGAIAAIAAARFGAKANAVATFWFA